VGWLPRGNNSFKADPPAALFFIGQFRVKVNEDLRGGVVRETACPGATSAPPPLQNAKDAYEWQRTTGLMERNVVDELFLCGSGKGY
jgi:hypothetical protein